MSTLAVTPNLQSFTSFQNPDEVKLTRWEKFNKSRKNPAMYALFMLALMTAGMNSDQQLIAPNLSVIAKDFNMTDLERDQYLGGYLALAFFVIAAPMTMITGYISDKINRIKFYTIIAIIGETGCLLTIFVTGYWGLFATRAMTGFSLGGTLPLTYSLISDWFTDEWRGKASSIIGITLSIGVAVGQVVASTVGPATGNWRIPFVIVSIPTLVLAPIFYCTVPEPARGGKEKVGNSGEVYDEKMSFDKLKLLLRSPTVMLMAFQGLPGSVPWGIMLTYFQDYLVNDIGKSAPELGITIENSTIVVLSFGLGGGIGVILGGIIADKLWAIKYEYVPFFMAATTAAGAIPIYAVLNAPPMQLYLYAVVCFFSGILATMTGTAGKPLVINVTLPETRGSAFGLLTLTDELGKGLGPFWVSLLIGAFGGHRQPAFNWGLTGWFICSLALLGICCGVRWDVNNQIRRLQEATRTTVSEKDGRLEA